MLTLRSDTVHVWYLDASALVKLVVDEGQHEAVRHFFNSNTNFHATSLCLMEALGAIKAKWAHGRIDQETYLKATKHLVINAWGKRIRPDNVDLFTPEGLQAAEGLAKRHSIDLSDALQLETLLRGTFRHLAEDSRPILITADKGLAGAAEAEGIRVWRCHCDPAPVEA